MLLHRFVLVLLCAVVVPVQAGSIDHTNITATTSLTASNSIAPGTWSVDEVVDGSIADNFPYFGFVSTATSGTISLQLDDTYDLTSFELWNDVNVGNQGVRNFHLDFLDANDDLIGSTATFNAVSMFAAQTFSFATVSGVSKVDFVIETVSLQIEIRELAFNGQLTAVPAPMTALVFLVAWLGFRRNS